MYSLTAQRVRTKFRYKINVVEENFSKHLRGTTILSTDLNKIIPMQKHDRSNINGTEYLTYSKYNRTDPDLNEFSQWHIENYHSDLFRSATSDYIELQKGLETEHDRTKRAELIIQGAAIINPVLAKFNDIRLNRAQLLRPLLHQNTKNINRNQLS